MGATRGAKGSLFLSGDATIEVGAPSVIAVDTNGAGDAFQAGLIHGLLSGWNHNRYLSFATGLAAVQCMVPGPTSHIDSERIMNRMDSLPWKRELITGTIRLTAFASGASGSYRQTTT